MKLRMLTMGFLSACNDPLDNLMTDKMLCRAGLSLRDSIHVSIWRSCLSGDRAAFGGGSLAVSGHGKWLRAGGWACVGERRKSQAKIKPQMRLPQGIMELPLPTYVAFACG